MTEQDGEADADPARVLSSTIRPVCAGDDPRAAALEKETERWAALPALPDNEVERVAGRSGFHHRLIPTYLVGGMSPRSAAHPPTRYTLIMFHGSTAATPASHDEAAHAVDTLVDECRDRALWFVRPDYYPRTDDERRRILDAIQKHGDVVTFQRAARLQEWLSRHSSAASASS